ncbi:MAG: hypothetical protein WC628_01830 [Candidatus Omnitrophota bacterium]
MKLFLFCLCLGLLCAGNSFAQDEEADFKQGGQQPLVFSSKGVVYDVYYSLSNYDAAWVEGVRIGGTAKIGEVVFLLFKTSFNNQGYILLDSVRSIIPTGLRSKRVEDTNKR